MDSTLLLALWVAAASSVLLLLTAQNRGPCYVCTPAGSPSLTCCRQFCPSEALRIHKGLPSPFAAPAQPAECQCQPAAGSPAPVTLPGPDRAYVIPPYSAGTSETTAGNIIQTADVVFSLTGPDAVPFQTDRQTLFAVRLPGMFL